MVVAVSIQEPPDAVRAYVAQYGLDYTIGLDSTGAIARTYGVFGIPTHYFVDRDWHHQGPIVRAIVPNGDGAPTRDDLADD